MQNVFIALLVATTVKCCRCLGQDTLVKKIPDLTGTDLDKYGSNQKKKSF